MYASEYDYTAKAISVDLASLDQLSCLYPTNTILTSMKWKKTQNILFYALGTIEHDVITDVVENHNRLKYLAQSDSSDIQFGGIPKCD